MLCQVAVIINLGAVILILVGVIFGFFLGRTCNFHLQTGIQLLAQFLHDGPVSRIDLKTKLPAKDNYASDQVSGFERASL